MSREGGTTPTVPDVDNLSCQWNYRRESNTTQDRRHILALEPSSGERGSKSLVASFLRIATRDGGRGTVAPKFDGRISRTGYSSKPIGLVRCIPCLSPMGRLPGLLVQAHHTPERLLEGSLGGLSVRREVSESLHLLEGKRRNDIAELMIPNDFTDFCQKHVAAGCEDSSADLQECVVPRRPFERIDAKVVASD